MYLQTEFGRVWVSAEAPYWKDFHGRQAYKYLFAGKAAGGAGDPRQPASGEQPSSTETSA